MKRRGLTLVLIIILLFSGCGKKNDGPVSELKGAGYHALYQVGETCYLTDDSGVIYTMDLVTGEKELYGKPPVSAQWAADPSLSCIYYMKEDTLCRYTIATEAEDVICSLPGCDYIQAVTEDYVLYTEGLFPDGDPLGEAYICSLDLTTLESNRETDAWGNLIGTSAGNLIFTADMVQAPSEDRTTPYGLWSFGVKDLDSGEQIWLLEEQPNYPFEKEIAVIEDTVYFILNATVYAMPVTGGEMVPVSSYANNLKLAPCGNKGFLATSFGPDDTAVWYYDHATGTATTLFSTVGIESIASDGSRYAILTSDLGNVGKIIFGNIPAP